MDLSPFIGESPSREVLPKKGNKSKGNTICDHNKGLSKLFSLIAATMSFVYDRTLC